MRRAWCRLIDWWSTWVVPPCPLTPEEYETVYGPSRDRSKRGKARVKARRAATA